MGLLEKKIDDTKFLNVIRKMAKAGYVEEWKYHNTHSGTPQGGIVTLPTKLPTCRESSRVTSRGPICAPGMVTGFGALRWRRSPRVSAPLGGSKEAVMARRERLRPTALTVHITFEPSRGTPDCVARADECVGPMPRRPVAESPPTRRPQDEGGLQPGGRRKVS